MKLQTTLVPKTRKTIIIKIEVISKIIINPQIYKYNPFDQTGTLKFI